MKTILRRMLIAAMAVTVMLTAAACNKPENGQIGVVRNGGTNDSSSIRTESGDKGVLCPGASATWNGWGSDTHQYPASDQQRTFKFNDDKDADTDPIKNLRTSDGFKVTLRGTVYFKTAFGCDSAEGKRLVKEFDQANFSRPEGQRPWQDWEGFLENQWKPILDSTARDALLGFEVKQVLSSAALLSSNTKDADKAVEGVDNKGNIQRIEKALAEGLAGQLRAKLGGSKNDYFTDIVVNMEQPTLPDIDDKIAEAQGAFAAVAKVRAERLSQQEQVQVEIQKRQVAFQRAKGYKNCPSCARQDELKAFAKNLPGNVNTLVLGSGSGISLNGSQR